MAQADKVNVTQAHNEDQKETVYEAGKPFLAQKKKG